MSQCRFRASEGAYKPRSVGGWHMGSRPTLQRATGCLNRSVQPPDERMGFVQAWRSEGCLSTGGAGLNIYAPARLQATRARRRARIATPPPPPPTVASGDFSQFFLTFSTTMIQRI
jgi:hypothetical protein